MSILTGQTQEHLIFIEEINRYFHKEVYSDFLELKEAAANEGIELYVTSSFRSYEDQLNIWNKKARGEKTIFDSDGIPLDFESLTEEQLIESIMRWSAIPGASRHHWGTDLDIVDKATWPDGYHVKLTPEEFSENGPFYKLKKWFDAFESESKFFRPYAEDHGGVAPEMWHISHRQIAGELYRQYTINTFIQHIEDKVDEILLADLILAKPEYYFDSYVTNINLG